MDVNELKQIIKKEQIPKEVNYFLGNTEIKLENKIAQKNLNKKLKTFLELVKDKGFNKDLVKERFISLVGTKNTIGINSLVKEMNRWIEFLNQYKQGQDLEKEMLKWIKKKKVNNYSKEIYLFYMRNLFKLLTGKQPSEVLKTGKFYKSYEKRFLRQPSLLHFYIFEKYSADFVKFLIKNKEEIYNQYAQHIKEARKKLQNLTKEEMIMLGFTDYDYYLFELSKLNKEDIFCLRFMLLFIALTGCRKTEAINLKKENVFLDKKLIGLIGKGEKKRVISINEQVVKILKRIFFLYKPYKTYKHFEYVFPKIKKYKTKDIVVFKTWHNSSYLNKFLKGFLHWANRNKKVLEDLKKFGVNQLSLDFCIHQLRHTFATYIYKKTKDVIGLRDYLGHSDIKFTEIYAKDIQFGEDVAKSISEIYTSLKSK